MASGLSHFSGLTVPAFPQDTLTKTGQAQDEKEATQKMYLPVLCPALFYLTISLACLKPSRTGSSTFTAIDKLET